MRLARNDAQVRRLMTAPGFEDRGDRGDNRDHCLSGERRSRRSPPRRVTNIKAS
jgi:hypothetical protein